MKTSALWITILLGISLTCCCVIPSCDRRMWQGRFQSPNELPPARMGQPYQTTMDLSDTPASVQDVWVQRGTLPQGLTLTFVEDTNSVAIAGTPEEAGAFEFVVQARGDDGARPGGQDARTYTLVVK